MNSSVYSGSSSRNGSHAVFHSPAAARKPGRPIDRPQRSTQISDRVDQGTSLHTTSQSLQWTLTAEMGLIFGSETARLSGSAVPRTTDSFAAAPKKPALCQADLTQPPPIGRTAEARTCAASPRKARSYRFVHKRTVAIDAWVYPSGTVSVPIGLEGKSW